MRVPSVLFLISGFGFFIFGAGAPLAGPANADTPAKAALAGSKAPTTARETAANVPQQAEKRRLIYRPPLRGAPTRRVGGSSRAPGVPAAQVIVFATENTGLTMHERPTLYWYVSKQVEMMAEFTLVDPKVARPVVRTVIEGPIEARVHAVRLSDFGASLTPGKDYEWSVALIPDPRERSRDIVSSGTIRFVRLSQAVRERIRRTPQSNRQFAYAEEGFWYDAIAAVSGAIAEQPNDRMLMNQRASLLTQVGLHEFVDLVDGQ